MDYLVSQSFVARPSYDLKEGYKIRIRDMKDVFIDLRPREIWFLQNYLGGSDTRTMADKTKVNTWLSRNGRTVYISSDSKVIEMEDWEIARLRYFLSHTFDHMVRINQN